MNRKPIAAAFTLVLALGFALPVASHGQSRNAGGATSREKGSTTTKQPARKSLADLVPEKPETQFRWQEFRQPTIDEDAVVAHGIRKLTGKHLTLYTDLPRMPSVDELPVVFDAAVPQWCEYFHVPLDSASRWNVVAYVIQDKKRFTDAGLLPSDLPAFQHGYQRGAEVWLYEQPSEYYRRHLLLHEGTHAFMHAALGGAGPPWYMEGMAELLGTHRWQDGRLTLRYVPRDNDEVPQWGRVKIVKDAYAAGQAKQLIEIFNYDWQAHTQVEPYGWCWATALFFDEHPTYRERFRNLRNFARDSSPGFSERFIGLLGDDWPHVIREWQWYVAHLDYSYDVAREAILRKEAAPLPDGGLEIKVAADRGWQSSGVRIEAGTTYQITARGRFQIASEPKTWWCEPNGVTLRYCSGRPLGMLLGAIVDESSGTSGLSGFNEAAAIGPGVQTTPKRSGTLYFRVNDFAGELADNAGFVTVEIQSKK